MRPDAGLFLLINGLAGGRLDSIMMYLAESAIFIVPAIVFALWAFRDDRWRRLAWGTLSAFGISYAVSALLAFPRPEALGIGNQLFPGVLDGSFPSDHAAYMFGAASSMRHNKKLMWILLALGILVGFSRIYIGIHFPLDILAGALLGFLIPIFLDRVVK